jgi:hypothetical protein
MGMSQVLREALVEESDHRLHGRTIMARQLMEDEEEGEAQQD